MDCSERVTLAEMRILTTEDNVTVLQEVGSLQRTTGMSHPSWLKVTNKDRSHIFNSPNQAEHFIKKIQSDSQPD